MTFDMPKESIVFLGGILLSSVLIPLFLPVFRRFGVVDLPNARSSHTSAIPRGTGLIVVFSFVVILSGYTWIGANVAFNGRDAFAALLCSVMLLVSVGFLDDTRGVPALVKLVFQCGSAVILIAAGFVMPLPEVFGGYQEHAEQLLTLFWIVGVINAINFIDGSDGLATTLSTLCMLLFVGISRIVPKDLGDEPGAVALTRSINILGLAGAGSAFPFLLYNMSPAKCFLGDSGSTFFGLILSILGILVSRYHLEQTPADAGAGLAYGYLLVPWFVLFVPIADAIRVTIGRALRGRSPLRPDNRHLHHLLHRAGLTPNQMLFLVTLAVAMFGLVAALVVRSSKSPYLLLGVFVLIIYGLLWFLKSSYRARRFVTLALNRRLLHFMDVTEGYENAASFKERFEQELARAKRHRTALSVLVVSTAGRKVNSPHANPLDNPKFLENLLHSMRREDIKCRISTDRLAFLLVETDKELGTQVCERIDSRFEGIKQGESADLQVGLGLSSFPEDGDSVPALLQRAEAASSLKRPAEPEAGRTPTLASMDKVPSKAGAADERLLGKPGS
jgi:UDP-GlcNAc:undecaprenyl-phosphate GlcNAc-1-phosphate transferase